MLIPESNRLIRPRTKHVITVKLFALVATRLQIVMDVSQIKNVAFLLGELPSNIISILRI